MPLGPDNYASPLNVALFSSEQILLILFAACFGKRTDVSMDGLMYVWMDGRKDRWVMDGCVQSYDWIILKSLTGQFPAEVDSEVPVTHRVGFYFFVP